MKKKILLFILLLAATPLWAQERKAATLMNAFDLDGEAADADQIVTAANGDLTDTKSFTITAQPDTCRLIDVTQTDANSSITVGKLTIVGTDCLGYPLTTVLDYAVAANRGSGVKSPVSATGASAYYSAITTIDTNALTGEGGAGVDLVSIGYTSNSVKESGMYGVLKAPGPNGEHGVDPFASTRVVLPITTAGVLSTTVTSVATNAAFTDVVAGDLLIIPMGGIAYERKVTARASADSITVNQAIMLPAAGVPFYYKHFYHSTNPQDLLIIPTEGALSALFTWSVDANADTGGVIELLECTAHAGPDYPGGAWAVVETNTIATGSTQVPAAVAVDLVAKAYKKCRFTFRFGTGDDGDGAAEDINLDVVLMMAPPGWSKDAAGRGRQRTTTRAVPGPRHSTP